MRDEGLAKKGGDEFSIFFLHLAARLHRRTDNYFFQHSNGTAAIPPTPDLLSLVSGTLASSASVPASAGEGEKEKKSLYVLHKHINRIIKCSDKRHDERKAATILSSFSPGSSVIHQGRGCKKGVRV
mmetsp:Transcript_26220/g.66668  ORF Transcript_26220/g.66668 Transcript_26220/m.66668 type:complete len:127 (+) Transcript_26220:136-516(+)